MHRLARAALVVCLLAAAPAAAQEPVDIPYTKYVLDNGLRLIVHEDHKAPIVAVNVWYDVGAADEEPGKTGFAHLFEHLMFNGSEHYNDDYFKPFDRVGATGMNGTTNQDRTNYFQVVPTTALDMALWMESDRMGHMLGAVDQARLDEQRGVVQNEKRQGENQPYGKVFLTIFENTYPTGHPYDHSTIGSMDDLNAASLDDVRTWFETWYGAANAVLVVAGDVDPEDVRARVERHFGHIPSGPPLIKPDVDLARRTGESRIVLQDRVPQARVYKAWNVAALGDPALDHLALAGDVLAGGRSSRLYRRLVYEDQIATDVSAFALSRQFGSLFILQATAQPGQDLAAVEAVLDEELRAFLESGPTAAELARAQTRRRASFVRGVERIGGFGGKSDVLAQSEVYLGSPDGHLRTQQTIIDATPADVRAAAVEWVSRGALTVEVRPFTRLRRGGERHRPLVGAARGHRLPRRLVPRPRDDAPVQRARGHPRPARRRPGGRLQPAARRRLRVGPARGARHRPHGHGHARRGHRVAHRPGDRGGARRPRHDPVGRFQPGPVDGQNVDPEGEPRRLPRSVRGRRSRPRLSGRRVRPPTPPTARGHRPRAGPAGRDGDARLPRLLYGQGHAYSQPLSGSGTEETLNALTLDGLRAFHDTWFRPDNATLIVVGDVTLAELEPALEARFADWEPGEVPVKNLGEVDHQAETVVYLIDRPDSEQSIIFAGHVAPPRGDPRDLQIQTMNNILGGGFTARINMNLREDKGWSYGAQSLLLAAAGQRPYFVFAPVQTDRTADSMAEIDKEIAAIRTGGDRPPTAEELARVKDQRTLTLPGRWETNGAVMADILQLVRFGLPDDYWETYAATVRALTLDEIRAEADRVLQPDGLIWVVVGDRGRIEESIRELDLGPVRFLDADGNPVEG